jgi:hypothetical protein
MASAFCLSSIVVATSSVSRDNTSSVCARDEDAHDKMKTNSKSNLRRWLIIEHAADERGEMFALVAG